MFQKGMRLPPCRSQLKRWQLRAAAVPSGHALNSGAYTVDALASIRAAQREALRARSMFVAPPHLLLGVIIANPNCAGARLLASSGMGDQTTARRMLGLTPDQVEEQMSSAASPGDLHFAPDARRALSIAATTAVEEGANHMGHVRTCMHCMAQQPYYSQMSGAPMHRRAAVAHAGAAAAGTAHLVLGLLCCDCGAINGALDGLGVPRGQLAEQVRRCVLRPGAAASMCWRVRSLCRPSVTHKQTHTLCINACIDVCTCVAACIPLPACTHRRARREREAMSSCLWPRQQTHSSRPQSWCSAIGSMSTRTAALHHHQKQHKVHCGEAKQLGLGSPDLVLIQASGLCKYS